MMVKIKKLSNEDLYEFIWQSGVDNIPKTRKSMLKLAKNIKQGDLR